MITHSYTRTVPLGPKIASSAREIFDLLLTHQATIADIDYNRRTAPHLADVLSPSLATVSLNDDSVEVAVNYPLTIRFLDIKKTKKGRNKRVYKPIYNRPLWGHLYGRGYSLSNVINAAIGKEYQNYLQNLKNIKTTIGE